MPEQKMEKTGPTSIQKKLEYPQEIIKDAADFTSSGTRVWNLFMMFFVLVGSLPVLFPNWVGIQQKGLVLAIAGLVLLTSLVFEVWRNYLERKGKKTDDLIAFQLITRLFLLTGFLHFFGYINGPFFVLYLLLVMEVFLNQKIALSSFVISFMVFATTAEFFWLVFAQEIYFDFTILVAFIIRIISIIFMYAYGTVLAEKMLVVKKTTQDRNQVKEKYKKIAKELKRTNARLKEMSELKDEFVSVASHELRAPMAMIKGYLSMILEGDVGKIPPKVKEFLKDAYESNERMVRLVNNMLNISRIESGQMAMELKDIQIEKAVEKVVEGYRLEAETHGLELKYFKPENKLSKIRVDPDRIKEVISNLVGNAINFTPHGHVHVRSYEENGMVTVTVEDTGVGIAPENQEQLFKKFSQVDIERPFRKGSGLGLYISKTLVNEFGGEIWLKSKVGEGTTFYFSLPAIVNRQKKERIKK